MFFFLFAIITYLTFWINIPFYVAWVKRQEQTEECFLYLVKGKFTHANVLAMVETIETKTGTKLIAERKKIKSLKATCDKRNVSFSAHKKRVHRMLKEKAFGSPMMLNAFKRMRNYSKFMAICDVMIYVSIILYFINSYSYEGYSSESVFYGITTGLFAGAPLWVFAHKSFNGVLKRASEKQLTKHKTAGYFQIAMAHFWGCTAGMLWKDLFWQGKSSSYFMAIAGGISFGAISTGIGIGSNDGTGGFGGGGFGGGGAGGDW